MRVRADDARAAQTDKPVEDKAASKPERPAKSAERAPTRNTGPLGVDESGAWSFYLAPTPQAYQLPLGAGYRLATVVRSKTHGETRQGRGYLYSYVQVFLLTLPTQSLLSYRNLIPSLGNLLVHALCPYYLRVTLRVSFFRSSGLDPLARLTPSLAEPANLLSKPIPTRRSSSTQNSISSVLTDPSGV